MGTLNEKAILELLLDATKSLQGLEAVRAKWGATLAQMQAQAAGVEAPPTSEAAASAIARGQGVEQGVDSLSSAFKTNEQVFAELQAEFDAGFSELDAKLGKAREGVEEWRKEVVKAGDDSGTLALKLGIAGAAIFAIQGAAAGLSRELASLGKEMGATEEQAQKFTELTGAFTSLSGALRVPVILIRNLKESVTDFIESLSPFAGVLEGIGSRLNLPWLEDFGRLVKGNAQATRDATEAVKEAEEAEKRRAESLAALREQVKGNIPELLEQAESIRKLREEIEAAGGSKVHLENLAGEAKKLLDQFAAVGQEAPEHLKKLVAAFTELGEVDTADLLHEVVEEEEELEKQTPKTTKQIDLQKKALSDYDKQVSATIAQLRLLRQAIKDSVSEQRQALGVDDLEQQTADLRKEIEELEGSLSTSIDDFNRLDEAKQQLTETERKLRDAMRQSTIEFDEQELAQVEGELAAAEWEQAQRKLADAFGGTADELGELTEAQKEATTAAEKQTEEAEKAVDALKQLEEGAKAAADSVIEHAKRATDAISGFGFQVEQTLDRIIEKLEKAKQCAAEVAGAVAGP